VAVREVLLYPDRRLKQVARPAQAAEVDDVARDLIETMRSFGHCVGLAAPQIGEMSRVAVVDVSEHPKAETSNGLLVLANPRVVESEGAEVAREGCLSLPDVTANVRRATRIVVEHAAGRVECSGFEARCVLHELDHLDGVLFLDRVESLVDDVFRRRSYSPPGEERDAPAAAGGAPKSGGSEGSAADRTA
jgi:peptide deformylase